MTDVGLEGAVCPVIRAGGYLEGRAAAFRPVRGRRVPSRLTHGDGGWWVAVIAQCGSWGVGGEVWRGNTGEGAIGLGGGGEGRTMGSVVLRLVVAVMPNL